MAGNRQKTLFETWNPQGLEEDGRQTSGGGGDRGLLRPPITGGRSSVGGRPMRGHGTSERRETRGGRYGRGSTRKTISTGRNDDGDGDGTLDLSELYTSISKDSETVNKEKTLPGFDETAGTVWIYPTNSKVRDYQFDIVQTALFNNTLVSLPTGLGKTFIAAVVMYNFNRWYPKDVIVFMAPTRPLVKQQLEACHNIVGIPPSKTVELTGQISPKKREEHWKTKTVFFLTPQVMASDLSRGACPVNKVRCVVVDEAHKATGNHAFVQVISKLREEQSPPFFRVLALSATPGSDINAVKQILRNLLISRVEIRSEDSPDILPYTHQKKIEKVVLALPSHMVECRNTLLEVFQKYTGSLMKQGVLFGRDGSSFTPFKLIQQRASFRSFPPINIPLYKKSYIEGDFATSISLSYALELLNDHGLRSCYGFLQGIIEKERASPIVSAELRKNPAIRSLLNEIQEKLNISVDKSSLNSSALFTTLNDLNSSSHFPTVALDGKAVDHTLSHPKLGALKDIVVKHFQAFVTKGDSTRIIVFSQFRDSVQEIGEMLDTLRPLVRPMIFIGQAKSGGGQLGFNQKRQGKVLELFRSGDSNVLVATSIGEEGLDIGEVDLIICYDTNRSPTRLVQRMGRSGRQREGKTIFLLTSGKEEQIFQSSISLHNSISKAILDVNRLNPYLYEVSPRMVPFGVDPTCYKMTIVLTSERDDYNLDTKETNVSKSKKRPAPAATITGAKSSAAKKSKIQDDDFRPSVPSLPLFFASKASDKNQKQKSSGPGPDPTDNDEDHDDGFGCIAVPSHENEHGLFLCDFFVVNDRSQCFGPCLHMPPCKKFISVLPAFVTSSQRRAALSQKRNGSVHPLMDLEVINEELESLALVGSVKGQCTCGNLDTLLTDSDPAGAPNNGSPACSFHSYRLPVVQSKQSNEVSKKQNVDPKSNIFDYEGVLSLIADGDLFEEEEVQDNQDPFADGFDDWFNEVEEALAVSIFASVDRKEFTGSTLSTMQDVQIENLNFEIENEHSEILDVNQPPVEVGGGELENGSENEKGQRYTRTQLHELFQDDQILFEEDGDYTNSDNESTASSGGFGSPVRRILRSPLKAPKITEFSSASNTRFRSKSGTLVFPPAQESSSLVFRSDNVSSIAREEDVLLEDSPMKTTPKQKSVSFFESKPSMQSTPVCAYKKEPTDPVKVKVEMMDEFPDDDDCPSSPDLSQFRIENRIKNALVPNRFFETYASMTSPDNNSADMLNEYVESMRMKSSQNESRNVKQDSDTSSACKQELEFSNSKGDESGFMNESSDVNKPKKKFVFKRRPSGPATPHRLPVLKETSTPPSFIRKPNIMEKPKPSSSSVNPGDNSQATAPPEILGPVSRCVVSPTFGSSKKQPFSSVRRPCKASSPSLLPSIVEHEKPAEKWISHMPKRRDVDNLKQDVRKYQKQYCYSHVFDSEDFVEDVWNDADKLEQAKREEQDKIKQIIERKRLLAVEIRNSKKREEEELHHLKEIKPMNFRIPQPIKTQSYLEPSKGTPITQSSCKAKKDQENFPKTTPTFIYRKTGTKVPTDEFSDDDDFDFVKPQRRAQKPILKSDEADTSGSVSNKSEDLSPPTKKPLKKVCKRPRNPYVEYEAEVSGGDSSDGRSDDDTTGDDLDTSFVTQNFNQTVSYTQQARYVQSVRDILPVPFGRERRQSSPPVTDEILNSEFNESYDQEDSFCVANDDVEFADVGIFTQAMQKAKIDLENDGGAKKRVTRYGRRKHKAEETDTCPAKRRKRIYTMDDSSEED